MSRGPGRVLLVLLCRDPCPDFSSAFGMPCQAGPARHGHASHGRPASLLVTAACGALAGGVLNHQLLWYLSGDVLAAPASALCGWKGVNSLCALDHVWRACCAIALAGVPSVAAHSNNPVLTMINRAVGRFWDLFIEFCVLGAAPLSWQCNVAAAHPFTVWKNSWTVRSLP